MSEELERIAALLRPHATRHTDILDALNALDALRIEVRRMAQYGESV